MDNSAMKKEYSMHLLDSINLSAAIATMSAKFDTHKLILTLAHSNQELYVSALNECTSETPFKELHGQIGKALKARPDLRELDNEPSYSDDIFGHKNTCSTWEKI
jgi:hypothetical protein